jgi:uncharacterized protein
MSKAKIVIYSGILIAAICTGYFLFQNSRSRSFTGFPEVDWRQLGELDYITGAAPETLKALDGKEVRIPGFMVPLEDNARKVTEFLLVPSPQACIHVPPPPSNQMVLVEMEETANAKVEFGPIWIYGKLMLHSKRHMYGESSFTMKGMRVEPYR